MTKQEAIKNLKKCKSFHNGSYGKAIDMAIKALEQEPILDKVSAEIKNSRDIQSVPYDDDYYSFLHGVDRCLGIIDKYKTESEE